MTNIFDRLKGSVGLGAVRAPIAEPTNAGGQSAAPAKTAVVIPLVSAMRSQHTDVGQTMLVDSQPHQPARAGVAVPTDAVEVLGAIAEGARDIARLVAVPGESAGYMLTLSTQSTSAKIHTLRQILGQKYKPLHIIAVSADELSKARTGAAISGQYSPQSGASDHKQVSLNIARGYELIDRAIALKASDIHIDVVATGRVAPMVAIRFRVHGALTDPDIVTTAAAVAAMVETVRGLYQNDDISPAGTRVGGMTLDYPVTRRYEAMLKPPVKNAEVRFECMPEKAGFFVVMRLNGYEGKSAARKSLTELGLSPEQQDDLNHAASSPHGLVLVVGPTGSGKTTTVTTVLALDPHAKNKRRISLEIPPESDVPWLSQIPTSEELLADHADGVVRSDPDVISGGEVRNRMTATMAQDYALTGHLTWVTFHGNGVFAAFVRLLSDRIQFDRDILTMDRFLRAAFFQYLIGVLCTHCRKPAHSHLDSQQADVLQGKFGLEVGNLFVRHHSGGDATPCPHCRGTGIVDRTLAAEIVVPTRTMLRSIAKGDIAAAELEYRQQRRARFDEPGTLGKTYVEHALYKVSQGIACAAALFEMENLYTYEIEPRPCDLVKPLRLVGDGT